jgi:hypothetical protein
MFSTTCLGTSRLLGSFCSTQFGSALLSVSEFQPHQKPPNRMPSSTTMVIGVRQCSRRCGLGCGCRAVI